MARIAGVNLPTQKRLEIGLTYIFGIGQSTAQTICRQLELDPNEKVRDLTDEEVTKLRNYIDSELEVEVDTVRRAGHCGQRRAQGHGARAAEGRGVRQGTGLGPGNRDSLAPGRRPRDPRREGRDPAGPQWRASAQAEKGLVAWLVTSD